MNKHLTKTHIKNERIDSPLGLLGVPPDSGVCCQCCCAYCMLHRCGCHRRRRYWPQ